MTNGHPALPATPKAPPGRRVHPVRGVDSFYRQIIDTMTDGATTLSAAGLILDCNDSFANTLGRPIDRLRGTALRDYLAPPDQEALDGILAKARREPSWREVNLKSSADHLVPVHLSASRLPIRKTESAFWLVLRDLTEQKCHALIVAEERLARLILEQAEEAIVVCDGQGRIIRASQAARRLCDGSPLLRGFAEAFPLRPGTFDLAHVLRGKTLRNVEMALVRQGQELELILNAGPLVGDQQILGCVVTLTDITPCRQAEGSLRLLGTALNAAADATILTDRDGAIEWTNAAFTSLTGYSAGEAIGMNLWELVESGAHDAPLHQATRATILAGHVWRGETTNRRKDGSVYPEEQTITPVRNDGGEVTHFVAIARDLTARRDAEARFLQAQKMETVGRLAGGIAHDFNNLLTIINGTAELAAMDLQPDDPLRAEFDQIRRAGDRAAALTRQLLAFSRKQIVQLEALDLGTLVGNLQGMLRRLIGEDIALVVRTAEAPGSVMADPMQIEQVVMNLAVNAQDAMHGGGTLTIETRNVDLDAAAAAAIPSVQPGPYVMLTVSDTGAGMDEATRARIFEPFFTTKDLGKGTGLGLPTVYGIVQQGGGSIQVHSELAKGTTVEILLPRVEPDTDHGPAVPTVTTGRGTETILVVEDDEAVQHLARRVLLQAGYTVLTASTGAEALNVMERHGGLVHLVLTDIVMPGMSGSDLLAKIQETRPHMKVLYTSGYTDEVILRDALADKATRFIGKPYAPTDLTRRIREVLDRSN